MACSLALLSPKHLPVFIEENAEFKAKGLDSINCISINSAFVMNAWKENLLVRDDVFLWSDGNEEFTKAIDQSEVKMVCYVVGDGVVKILNLEEGSDIPVSPTKDMLEAL
ncbi:Peroxiredoxin-2E, chloroplastic [Sesamum angolense]|uniref:glutaredoxin-dependent peroxiredoxin n=1 Tax=Sesamum angolense TaxID=2727404 RepID=A0AAE1WND9_9LAMI|nr:Peroxiredoxin-2E, chloroplastic [Sesamum angolense]